MKSERGFTLPELLVAGVICLMLIGGMLLLIRPNDYAAEKRNAERRLHLATIMSAIKQYEADKGVLPPTITTEEKSISTEIDEELGSTQSLCDDLVPEYMEDLPRDPAVSMTAIENSTCAAEEQLYVSGYTVRLDGGTVILGAPASEKDEVIEFKKWFSLL